MQKVSEFLIEAKKVIENPAHWTTGWFARTATGIDCSSLDERAVCFCSLGALERYDNQEIPAHGLPAISRSAQFMLKTVMGEAVEDFNDEHSHEEVMKKWDEAIELAKAQEAK